MKPTRSVSEGADPVDPPPCFQLVQATWQGLYGNSSPDCSKGHSSRHTLWPGGSEKHHSDCWRGYDGPVDPRYQKHFHNGSANKCSHVNEIKSFRGFAKNRLVRFRRLPGHTFCFHLKKYGVRSATGRKISAPCCRKCPETILSAGQKPKLQTTTGLHSKNRIEASKHKILISYNTS